MNININKVKIEVTTPINNSNIVKKAMFDAGAGIINNYTNCSLATNCVGSFIANNNANPYIGKKNKLILVKEEKIEVLCNIEDIKNVIQKIKQVHPYEEPVINIIPLIDENYL